MFKLKAFFAALLIGIVFGCQNNKVTELPTNPNVIIADIKENINSATKELQGTNTTIQKEVVALRKETPDSARAIVIPHVEIIWDESIKQDAIIKRLQETEAKADKATQLTEAYKVALVGALKDKETAQAAATEAKSGVTKMMIDKLNCMIAKTKPHKLGINTIGAHKTAQCARPDFRNSVFCLLLDCGKEPWCFF